MRLDTSLFVLWTVVATAAVPDAGAADLSDFEWLAGTWKRESKTRYVYETWRILSDRTMEGESFVESKSTGERRFGEALLLARMGEDVYYMPRPVENPSPTAFRLTSLEGGRAVFENPDHDFPQQIVYLRQDDDAMTVSIAALSGENRIDFHFTRVAGPVKGTTSSGLYYEASGSGDPVVLVHGFSLDRRMWEGQVGVLEGKYRVVRYDLRGHGLSAAPQEAYAEHTDLLEVFDTLGLERASIVGLSAGGQAAIDFALTHPERVERLVLASSGLSGVVPQGPFDWMNEVVAALQSGDPEAATEHWVETELMKLGDPETHARMREIVLGNWRVWTHDRGLRQAFTPPANDRLAEIRVPTLVVLGERDLPDTLRVGEMLASGVKDVRRITLADAGHLVNLAALEAFNEALLRFLAGETSDPQD